ncbi:MAG: hypothetical protein L0Y76_04505 [Ignavibacteria bacterium]|nr:hypothetical protein [Ignavibacteria bacterium]
MANTKIFNIPAVFLLSLSVFFCGTKSDDVTQPAGRIINTDTIYFVQECDSVERLLKDKLTDDFCFVKSGYFLVVSNLSLSETKSISDNSIRKALDCFYNDYFIAKPEELVTVFLFKDDNTYRHWADKLYGDNDDLSPYGYYKESKKAMLMNIATGSGTLIHELTHSLVRYDFPDLPSWFNEGLGSLYERCSLQNNEIKGHVNWRLPTLVKAINSNKYKPLKTLMTTDDETFYGEESGINYSQARYFCMYLQEKGMLKKYYKKFRDNYEKDNTGISFAEEILNKTIKDIDKDFKSWVLTLK